MYVRAYDKFRLDVLCRWMQQVQTAMDAFQTTRLSTQRLAIERLNDRLHVLDQLDRAPLLYARLVTESARRLEFLRLHRMVRSSLSLCARTRLLPCF